MTSSDQSMTAEKEEKLQKDEEEGYISKSPREEESLEHAVDMAEIMAEFANINFAEMVDIPEDLG